MLPLLLLPVLLLPLLLTSAAATGQQSLLAQGPEEAATALRRAQAESRVARQRSALLEREAAAARGAADRTAREMALVAARIQQAEANLGTTEAQLLLVSQERAALREALGREQQPVAHLVAALQQFSRRPVALSLLRPGSVRDAVYLRAMLDSAAPEIETRTAELRARLARLRQLRAAALAGAQELRAQESDLAERRDQLSALEARQRLASRTASSAAAREAERALALAEQARDLDGLVAQLDRAGGLRARLAALPGPVLRPPRPEQAGPEQAELGESGTEPAPDPAASAAPRPYLLPVTGRTIVGFGAVVGASSAMTGGSASNGLTIAPRPGAQVVAPAAGRVVFAAPYRGYGRIVIIEHSAGWSSLVTGLARTDVAVGDRVVAGSPLGIAPQADPEITLELRRAGAPVNPLRFVG
jgi:septal ring factor EnvC (AmiA/AmiB activator)